MGKSGLFLVLGLAFSPCLVAGSARGEEDNTHPGTTEPVVEEIEKGFADSVTVAATRSERPLLETPGQVDVITAEEVEALGHTSITDLVLFAPGVYVEGDLTRLGTNGFNIRGVGGNRVLTQIDGIPTAEQFDFGPLSVTQMSLDLDSLERAEIVRSAGSALYGSNALGGVVSLSTRGPRSYLGDAPWYLAVKTGFDGRADELSESLTAAAGDDRLRGSLVLTHRDGEALDNQGTRDTEDATRTKPNPIDRRQLYGLGKLELGANEATELRLALEWLDGESETEVLSGRTPASPFAAAVTDFDAVDHQERRRVSAERSLVLSSALAESVLWRAYWQEAEAAQDTRELRHTARGLAQRDGFLGFDQTSFGVEGEARRAFGERAEQLLTYGLVARQDRFDGLRNRSEFLVATGAPVPSSLIFPTKYFPKSEVDELGAFVQGELSFSGGKLLLIPGVRFDRFELNPEENDAAFLNGNPGQPAPVALTDQAVSPKLGVVVALSPKVALFGQYARGFRAPPMSDVNNGFTNLSGGYRTLPNAGLEPETSNNLEIGARASFTRGSVSLTAFRNQYQDFIETVSLGFNPAVGLIEFQPQNFDEVEISGAELAGDLRFGSAWRLRGALSVTSGDNKTEDEPLLSIAPSRLVTGLRYAPTSARWGTELIATFVDSKDGGDVPSGSTQFLAPSYEVVDLAAWLAVNRHFSLQLSAWNLLDETYWQWAYVRGQAATSSTLDRFTSPGRSIGLQVRARF